MQLALELIVIPVLLMVTIVIFNILEELSAGAILLGAAIVMLIGNGSLLLILFARDADDASGTNVAPGGVRTPRRGAKPAVRAVRIGRPRSVPMARTREDGRGRNGETGVRAGNGRARADDARLVARAGRAADRAEGARVADTSMKVEHALAEHRDEPEDRAEQEEQRSAEKSGPTFLA